MMKQVNEHKVNSLLVMHTLLLLRTFQRDMSATSSMEHHSALHL